MFEQIELRTLRRRTRRAYFRPGVLSLPNSNSLTSMTKRLTSNTMSNHPILLENQNILGNQSTDDDDDSTSSLDRLDGQTRLAEETCSVALDLANTARKCCAEENV